MRGKKHCKHCIYSKSYTERLGHIQWLCTNKEVGNVDPNRCGKYKEETICDKCKKSPNWTEDPCYACKHNPITQGVAR